MAELNLNTKVFYNDDIMQNIMQIFYPRDKKQ